MENKLILGITASVMIGLISWNLNTTYKMSGEIIKLQQGQIILEKQTFLKHKFVGCQFIINPNLVWITVQIPQWAYFPIQTLLQKYCAPIDIELIFLPLPLNKNILLYKLI